MYSSEGAERSLWILLLAACGFLWSQLRMEAADCNENGTDDATDIAMGTSKDCNQNGVPDYCDLNLPVFDLADGLEITTGNFPWGVLTADLNGDGSYDIVVANQNSDSVTVFENIGIQGSVAVVGETYNNVGPGPRAVAAGDFDGDSHVDLIVATHDSQSRRQDGDRGDGRGIGIINNGLCHCFIVPFEADGQIEGDPEPENEEDWDHLRLLLNSGNPERLRFSLDDAFSTGGLNSMSLAVCDLDGDGDLDVAVGNRDSNDVSVLRNDGHGHFGPAEIYGTGTMPDAITVADLNLDGTDDVITANEASDNISVLLNTDDLFVAGLSLNAGNTPYDVKAADLDGDGDNEVVVVNKESNSLSVFLNRGLDNDRSWLGLEPAVEYFVSPDPRSVSVGDLNEDGAPDLAVASLGTNSVEVLFNDGDGTFRVDAPTGWAVGRSPRVVAMSDLNGDGKSDIMTTNASSHTLSILVNDPRPSSIDLNGSGIPDACEGGCNQNILSRDTVDPAQDCNANGVPDSRDLGVLWFAAEVRYSPGANPKGVAAADFDNDGYPDLATANFGADSVTVLVNDGFGGFLEAVDYPVGIGVTDLATYDLDRDGFADMAAAVRTENEVAILVNEGDGTFALPAAKYEVGLWPLSVTTANLNGDGLPDLVTANWRTNDLSLLIQLGNGNFLAGAALPSGLGAISVTAADLDDDGDDDLAAAELQSGNVSLFRNNGNGSFHELPPLNAGANPSSVTASDLDGDGRTDLLVVNSAFPDLVVEKGRPSGTPSLTLFWNDGSFSFSSTIISVGSKLLYAAAADLNGDELVDVAVTDHGCGQVLLLLNQGERRFGSPASIEVSGTPYEIALSDFEGDGRIDIATPNDSGSEVSVLSNQSILPVSSDCNRNGFPDECDDPDSLPDDCEVIPPDAPVVFKRGDADGNGVLEITDPISALLYLFLGTFRPRCEDALDFDDSGVIDISDPIANLTYQFLGGSRPAPPGLNCGSDLTEDVEDLDCAEYPEGSCG